MAPSSLLLTEALLILSLSLVSVAQLSACDAVDCPLDQNHNPTCTVGNSTAIDIGVGNFSTPLSDQPLTWTLSVQSLRDGQSSFERNFFLGTPPELNLRTRSPSDTQLCAIFFNGAIYRAYFPGTDAVMAQGTCNDALTPACVSDIRQQAEDFRVDNGNGSTSFCSDLGEALRRQAPPSCTVASDGEWTNVQARPLTGSEVPSPLPRGDCTPTTGENYALTQIESARIDLPSRNYSDIETVLYGVTPIMTVTWNSENQTVLDSELSCLKAVGPQENGTAGSQEGGGGRIEAGLSLGIGFFGMLWMLI